MIDPFERLRTLLLMTQAEVRSRANAWADVREAGFKVLELAGGQRQSSPEMSSLASEIIRHDVVICDPPGEAYNELLNKAKRLAGSVLSQDEIAGQGPGADDPKERARRGLLDAQMGGQARPLIRTVVIDQPSIVRIEPYTSDMAAVADAELNGNR